MSLVLAFVVLLGPPKLPPMPGRAMPTPQVEVADEPAPAARAEPPSTPAPSSRTDAAVPQPPPPPPPPSSSKPAAPTTTTASRAPASPIADAVFPGQKPPSPPPVAAPASKAAPVVGGAPTSALRVVSPGEVSSWESEDAKARAAAPKTTSTPSPESRDATLRRTAVPSKTNDRLTFRRSPHPPRRSAAFVLGYRYFRIKDALGRAQDWHLASLEVTPMRRYVRINLITEFGIEGGPAARHGDRADILLMERLGLGAQLPGVVTPFIEFQGGVGGARVELFGRNDLALLYALGLDAGAQWAVTKWMYLHAAIGWIRPTFVWPNRTSSFDRVAFKLGIGF